MKFLGHKKAQGGKGGTPRTTFVQHTSGAGYTLLELAVTLFIILTITAISRFGKAQFERSLVLTNLSYDIALAVRQAQTYGVNTRQADATATGSFDVGYGVRFSISAPTSFSVFLDANNDRVYNSGDSVVRNGSYTIKNNNKISSICVVPSGNTSCNAVSVLNITFRRPDPDACFNPSDNVVSNAATAALCQAAEPYSEARITIQAPNASTKTIKVYSTGQISLQ